MSDRIIYISRACPHCKKLLIGLHRYEFLKNQFQIIDVQTQQYPDYIETVPTLVANQQMIKNDDVFGYMNNLVEQIFRQNPEIRQKYHPPNTQRNTNPQPPQNSQPSNQQQPLARPNYESMKNIGQEPVKTDEVDELIGWCPDGGCSFSPITEASDDCSKRMDPIDDTRFSFISDSDYKIPIDPVKKVPMENSNQEFQRSEKLKQMDSSYERLMAERQLIK
jgi:glutaredoxin